ncbi:Maf-like protein [Clostridium subterminale]|uniref:dTTP/UTP pyrophosphatase n=1 Tax=Clostridium subterminale TaxID=1550 RepID=A0ABN1KJ26_CLOSU
MDIVLASASPRRQELLKRLVYNFQIEISNFDEGSIRFQGDIDKHVCDLAEGKARNILNKVQKNSIVIGCDTVVYLNGKILGKPINDKDAFEMLKSLSGNVHKVYSGLVLINSKTNELIRKSVCTEVKFMNLSEDMMLRYIKSGQCKDKAGAYGIQDDAAVFVENINGCYYNVVGLPLNTLYLSLREMGVNQ